MPYTTRNGETYVRWPFLSWGRYGMSRPMLADIDAIDLQTGRWTGANGGARNGAEFEADRAIQEMALDRWIDEVADPIADALGFYTFEGRVIDWFGQPVKVTRAGIHAALLAEGTASTSVFFGMLSRKSYKIESERDFPPTLAASFRVIGHRFRELQNTEPAR
jgi:hypothetical protein